MSTCRPPLSEPAGSGCSSRSLIFSHGGSLEAAPDISDNVKQLGCFFTSADDTDKKRQQKGFPIWCRQHKRIEKLILMYGVIHAIALGRGQGYDKDHWDEMLSDKERSHLCHKNACDSPLHFNKETGRQNRARATCANEVRRRLEFDDVDTVLQEARKCCPHTPPCWPEHANPCISLEQSVSKMEEAFDGAMREAGICKEHGLDFPVRIPRTMPFTNGSKDTKPYYSAEGKARASRSILASSSQLVMAT
ncbi:hypothetical protein HBI73_197900 [Parastagonospora nodorum]|nr:hypothetical protein HBH50_023740 [Parastagonospora nodorum]KAH4097754.1 hypothetical protein HBH48_023530 [Parastagonospora nodorum]KAH4180252.1 hypothetical protein HBH43_001430 [Parastagonospora nodorum]KAH4243550.1 hypothetical protein HBI05_085310 [Parastagonospora nodorum]KAH4262313.1 hypothetical protein HBI03_111370 [Parastagonospora nodorum]